MQGIPATQCHASQRLMECCGGRQMADRGKKDTKGAVALRQPYLRVVGLLDDIEEDARNSPTFSCVPGAPLATYAAHHLQDRHVDHMFWDHKVMAKVQPHKVVKATSAAWKMGVVVHKGLDQAVSCRLEEEAAFKEFAAQPSCLEDICGRIAPQIFGHPDIKQAIACLLFGGTRKVTCPNS